MSKKLIISENHILKLILDEFNNNSVGIKFMLSDWHSVQTSENDGTLLIQRRAFKNDRFDIVSTFDGNTYATKENKITPMGINSLNATFLAHPKIQEISYSPEVMFLISADREVDISANRAAIEEVRAGLMNKQVAFNISQYDLEDLTKRIEQQVKGVITAGEITYGDIMEFNGKSFMVMSVGLEIFVTNKGEFANQEHFLFGSSEILGVDGKPKMFDIPLITWDDGMGLDTNPTQLLPRLASDNKKASEVISYKVSKAYGLVVVMQMDFNNEFLRHIYLESRQVKLSVPTYYVEMWTEYYDLNNELKELEGSRIRRAMNLEVNKRDEPSSLGDKLEFTLSFSPSEKGWYE